jgi:hypothetical protein
MTLAEMIADLKSRIGSEPEVTTGEMTTWLNQGLLAFCNTYNYGWLETTAKGSTVSGQESYALPTDYKKIIELKVNDVRYFYVPYEQRNMYDSGDSFYTIINNRLVLNPVPDITSSQNISISYIRRPAKLVDQSDAPSDTDIANIPETYHEAIVLYAFAIYNSYDEEHGERADIMGNELRPIPGTFYWWVKNARDEETAKKRGQRSRMMGTKRYYGYSHPNQLGRNRSTVLGN